MSEHVEVLVVGGGLSGIGAGCRLGAAGRDYAVLEARDALGGTWDLFRYPGVRSDSDMFTLGYPFRPWRGDRAIADGPSILAYLRETAAAHGVDRRVRLGHRVVAAAWSSAEDRWTVDVEAGGERRTMTCDFLYLCTGYYSYAGGHVVAFPGRADFTGALVHPQEWPADLDVAGKRVVVIGSGATAVTLVPALAPRAAHVTMLQRSPTWMVSRPAADALSARLGRVLPEPLVHRVRRARSIVTAALSYALCRRFPRLMGRVLRADVARRLPADVPLDPHFTPRYGPWDQRLCLVPDGDLFGALRSGRASVVTDAVDRFTPGGVRLASGRELPADVVVTATGLELLAFGGIALTVDGAPVEPGEARVYKGMMLAGVPNLAWCIGYTNNSWTLRADLTSRQVVRLLAHLRRHGLTRATPVLDSAEAAAEPRPVLDLSSGYVARAASRMPKQGRRPPWVVRQNYLLDRVVLRLGRVDDGYLRLARARRPERVAAAG